MLPFLTDGIAALAAALSVVAPPVGVIVVLTLLWLLIAGRGRCGPQVRRPAHPPLTVSLSTRQKLVLVVVDAMKPAMLERAIAAGRAPAMAEIMRRGHYVPECVAAFPSVTPVCAATITTGLGPDRHGIPA